MNSSKYLKPAFEYQKAVISNAKAFATSLKDQGLVVAGDPEISFTQTHQVILNVGYGKAAKIARKLEENNIIFNDEIVVNCYKSCSEFAKGNTTPLIFVEKLIQIVDEENIKRDGGYVDTHPTLFDGE